MEFIVDSSSRDKSLYPSPCKFKYPIPEITSTINKIKLNGIAIPRSETNVNSSNYVIPFNIDDCITSVRVSKSGFGYIPGVYRSDSIENNVVISNPGIYKDGTPPVCEAVFSNGLLHSVIIESKGSLLFNGIFEREIDTLTVGAEPKEESKPAKVTLVVENGKLEEILISDPGDKWEFGVNNFGNVEYDTGLLFQRKGTKAIVEVVVNSDTTIESVSIEEKGEGYVIGTYGTDIVSGCNIDLNIPTSGNNVTPGEIVVTVGELRLAELRYGQYGIDSNHDGASGLCREVTRALQKASSPGDFPYTSLNNNGDPISVGSCSVVSSNPNADLSKKIVIRRGETTSTSGNDVFLELLFGTYTESNAASSLLGFGATSRGGSADSICSLTSKYTLFRKGFIIPDPEIDFYYQDLGVIGSTIFNLNDTPNYVVVRLLGHESLKKFRSQNENLNGGSFLAVFKTGTDNVYSTQTDSQTQKLEILGNDTIVINPAAKMSSLDIEIVKKNGDLYGTPRDLIMTFELNGE